MTTRLNDNEHSALLNGRTTEDGDHTGVPKKLDMALSIKIAAAMFSFSALGLFNSSIGAVLPLISHQYSLTDLHVSMLFLAGPMGYILAAQLSDAIHCRLGQRGIAVIGPVFQIVATLIIALHPKFGWVLVAFAIQGLGTGLLDGSWCAWAGSMDKANTVSGLLHGSYSVGGAAGPFLVTYITTNDRPWYLWYYILVAHSAAELVLLVFAFRNENASVYRQSKQSEAMDGRVDAKAIFRYRATWLCAAYFLTYVGTETAISGWVVSFMLRDREATPYLASLSSSGYWIGMAIGRLLLGFGTDRIGVRRATVLYFMFAIGLEALFASLRSPIASVILMTLLGFVMGPLFPSGVVVLTRLLPGQLHIAAVSFVASLGQVGGAFLPFAIGALVQSLGIDVFRFAILLQTILALVVWLAFARLRAAVPGLQPDIREESARED
ncbi:MFS general substrate transporter [Ophiobolus disseminans]|uniref:MFS general substrate transporter n=1 Tax=Ophiobolus disseminans TaxID=1469910 RepID=A0A6A7AJT0_9PLEO|nr:MFS general substrate transporter [Ophiobolus disseminans]